MSDTRVATRPYIIGATNTAFVVPTGGGFSPISLPGLLAWYQAADQSMTNVSVYHDAGITLATNGQDCLQWNDSSGNGRHIPSGSSPGPGYNTTGFNSKPTLNYNAGPWMVLSSLPMGSGSQASMYVTGFMRATSGNFGRTVVYTDSVIGEVGMINHNSPTVISAFDNSNFRSEATIVSLTNYRFLAIWDGANATFYLGSPGGGLVSQPSGATSFSFTTGSPFSIGAQTGGGGGIDGVISEVIITNSALGLTDRTNLDNYIVAKWGI